jgi:hypothetical protein
MLFNMSQRDSHEDNTHKKINKLYNPNNFQSLLNLTDKEEIKMALEEYNFDSVDENGQNIIHLACKDGNKEIISSIIHFYDLKNKTLDIISIKDKKKWTPIYYAIDISESGFPDVVGKDTFIF